jgi:hypothetical protein
MDNKSQNIDIISWVKIQYTRDEQGSNELHNIDVVNCWVRSYPNATFASFRPFSNVAEICHYVQNDYTFIDRNILLTTVLSVFGC